MGERTEDELNQRNIRIIEFAKEIALRFITDKLGGTATNEKVESFFKELKVKVTPDLGEAGCYWPQQGKKYIEISEGLVNYELIHSLGTLTHEIGHALSDMMSQGEMISLPLEEGFANIFSSECLNYYLKISPEKIRDFATREGLEYRERIYHPNSYARENEFIGAILETIRQTTGKHYDAEFEYLLGDKNKFLEIIRQTLGDECVEIFIKQKQDSAKTSLGYISEYNESLFKILEQMPIHYEVIHDGEHTRKADREDGTYNVYDLTLIEKSKNKQELTQTLQFLEKQKKSEKGIIQIREILKKNIEFKDFILDYLVESKNFGIEYIFEIVSSNLFDIEELNLNDKQMELVMSKIPGLEIDKLSEEQIKGLIKIGMKMDKPNEQLNKLLRDVEKLKIENLDIQLGVRIAKIKTDMEPKGHDLAALLKKYCAVPNGIEVSQEINYQLLPLALDYLENHAKNDPQGLKSITAFLEQIENKVNSGEELLDYEMIFYPLKEKFVELIEADIQTVKQNQTVCNIDIEGFEQIDQEKIFGNDLMGDIRILPFTTKNPLNDLLMMDKGTKLLKVFNKNTIAQCLNGRLLESAIEEYKGLDEAQRSMYLQVFVPMLEENPNQIPNISTIKEMCMSIIPYSTDQERDEENKKPFVQLIKQNIQQRQNPLEDLMQLYECKIPNDLRFIYDEIIDVYKEMLTRDELKDTPEKSIRQLILTAPKNGTIKELSSVLLSKQFSDMGLTTESFMKILYEERMSGLYHEVVTGKLSQEDLTKWIEFRTESYMKSVGKSENGLQQKALVQLQERVFSTGKVMHTPQYIEYKKTNGIQDFVIVGTEKENDFCTLRQDGAELETGEEISKQQNKGKKGIRALFKRKRDKEIIAETIVVGRNGDVVQAINRYETGRFEMVSLNMTKSKVKVLTREDLEPQDIGNNGSLVIAKDVVERLNVPVSYRETREIAGRDGNDKVTQREQEDIQL